jgi:hypothetical protein
MIPMAIQPPPDAESLLTAVGLAWGWLDQGAPEQALVLVQGCLQCWPKEAILELLEWHCLICLNRPVTHMHLLDVNQVPSHWQELTRRLLVRQQLNQTAQNKLN